MTIDPLLFFALSAWAGAATGALFIVLLHGKDS